MASSSSTRTRHIPRSLLGCFSSGTLLHQGKTGDSVGIANMVQWTIRAYGADAGRVFVTGVSAGAMMTGFSSAHIRTSSRPARRSQEYRSGALLASNGTGWTTGMVTVRTARSSGAGPGVEVHRQAALSPVITDGWRAQDTNLPLGTAGDQVLNYATSTPRRSSSGPPC